MVHLIIVRLRRAQPLGVAGALVVCLLLAACATQPQSAPAMPDGIGPYPISDGIKATVVGTPPNLLADLPADVPIEMRELAPLVERPVPPVLDYAVPLEYALAAQDEAAPLVFVIAGTGATAAGGNCRALMRMLYAVGYHVACLPSPTSVGFMVGAAPDPVPGYMSADVAALYNLMRAVRDDVQGDLAISGYALAGYSLGATQAAFVARYDERHGAFDFDRTLLINPAVSVWGSVQRMDALVADNLPGGINGVPAFLASLLTDLNHPYGGGNQPLRIDRQFLFRAMLAQEAGHQRLAAVVGLVFRLALANMAFAADVLTTSGKIVPAYLQLGVTDSLAPYLLASFKLTFADYIDQLLLPYWNRDGRQLSREQLIAGASLRSMRPWLARNPDIAVLTNADDPILSADGMTFLRTVFGERVHVFPEGGHLGNLRSRRVVNHIQDFFTP